MLTRAQQIDGQREFMPKVDQSRVRVTEGAKPFPLFLVRALWVLTIFEVDWFLYAITRAPFYRIPFLVVPVLGLMILFNHMDKKAIYWPLIVFVLLHFGASVLAENAGLSRGALKFMLYMVVLFAGSVSFLDFPAQMIRILKLYLLSFAWFGVQGIAGSGRVFWHPLMANEDSFGPLMVIGIAFSYFFALAASSRRWRLAAWGIFFLSVLGVIVSFARGAALAAGVVLLYVLLRSPRKFQALAGLALASAVVLPVAATILPLDSYIKEIQSVSEGDEGRTILWQFAWNVFRESPIYGVGAFNFGVVASMITPFDSTRSSRQDPGQMYNLGVHNVPLQILAEEGIIGIVLWLVMVVGFFRRIRRLRSEDAIARWKESGGDVLDLRMISLGLEGAMVGYLASCPFYNQIYIHWFWSLITIAYVLAGLTNPARKTLQDHKQRDKFPLPRRSAPHK
jgi:O-antigen ligase